MFFDIVTTVRTGNLEVLTYSSPDSLSIGQLVEIKVRNKSYLGICLGQSKIEQGTSSFEIKAVDQIWPTVLSQKSLDFIFRFRSFSWNQLPFIVGAILQPLQLISKKLKSSTTVYDLNTLIKTDLGSNTVSASSKSAKFEVYNCEDITLRIMYLIRSKLENSQNPESSQILILFPDYASLETSYTCLIQAISEINQPSEVLTYTSENSLIKNRQTVERLVWSNHPKSKIILATRSGISLPFNSLDLIILVDEANNNFIQEQNSLYFDSRDVSYLLSQIWQADLAWVSTLPSGRSLAFLGSNQTKSDQTEAETDGFKSISRVLIHERNFRYDENQIFSNPTKQYIERSQQAVLFIYPRRGDFRLTQCRSCGYLWYCPNCTAPLVAYRNQIKSLDLLCHHCQSKFRYPSCCPVCAGLQIESFQSGIDDLAAVLTKTYTNANLLKLDTSSPKKLQINLDQLLSNQQPNSNQQTFVLTTKLFDPRIPYHLFQTIIYPNAHNLFAGVEYLQTEELYFVCNRLLLSLSKSTHSPILIFDTHNPELNHLQQLRDNLDQVESYETVLLRYKAFLAKELEVRQKFYLPPFDNLLVLSVSAKQAIKAEETANTLYKWLLQETKTDFTGLKILPPTQAKLFKRKGYFTYLLVLKYPKKFAWLKKLNDLLQDKINNLYLQVRLNPRHVF